MSSFKALTQSFKKEKKMKGFNRVFLVGHIGSHPEIQKSKSGLSYTRLNLATNRSKKTEQGEWQEVTHWHQVTVWGKSAENCANYLDKGSAVAIEGHLETYQTKKNGENQNHTSIVAEEVHFLPKNSQSQQPKLSYKGQMPSQLL